MRMSCQMSWYTRHDRIKNEYIRKKVRVMSIVEKMVESCFGWLGHVWRRTIKASISRVDQMKDSLIDRSRGRPRKTTGETIKTKKTQILIV